MVGRKFLAPDGDSGDSPNGNGLLVLVVESLLPLVRLDYASGPLVYVS